MGRSTVNKRNIREGAFKDMKGKLRENSVKESKGKIVCEGRKIISYVRYC